MTILLILLVFAHVGDAFVGSVNATILRSNLRTNYSTQFIQDFITNSFNHIGKFNISVALENMDIINQNYCSNVPISRTSYHLFSISSFFISIITIFINDPDPLSPEGQFLGRFSLTVGLVTRNSEQCNVKQCKLFLINKF